MKQIHQNSSEITWAFLSEVLSPKPSVKETKIENFLSGWKKHTGTDFNTHLRYILNPMFIVSELYCIVLTNREEDLRIDKKEGEQSRSDMLDSLLKDSVQVKKRGKKRRDKNRLVDDIRHAIVHFDVEFCPNLERVTFGESRPEKNDEFEAYIDWNSARELIDKYCDRIFHLT